MSNSFTESNKAFVDMGMARIKRMKNSADEVTRELNLSPSAASYVLSLMYDDSYDASVAIQDRHTSIIENGALNVERNNVARPEILEAIYSLVFGYVGTYRQSDLARLTELWRRIQTIPNDNFLALGQWPKTKTAGLGFTSNSSMLISIIRVVGQVVISTKNDITEEEIVETASLYGCSPATSRSLAAYILASR